MCTRRQQRGKNYLKQRKQPAEPGSGTFSTNKVESKFQPSSLSILAFTAHFLQVMAFLDFLTFISFTALVDFYMYDLDGQGADTLCAWRWSFWAGDDCKETAERRVRL